MFMQVFSSTQALCCDILGAVSSDVFGIQWSYAAECCSVMSLLFWGVNNDISLGMREDIVMNNECSIDIKK